MKLSLSAKAERLKAWQKAVSEVQVIRNSVGYIFWSARHEVIAMLVTKDFEAELPFEVPHTVTYSPEEAIFTVEPTANNSELRPFKSCLRVLEYAAKKSDDASPPASPKALRILGGITKEKDWDRWDMAFSRTPASFVAHEKEDNGDELFYVVAGLKIKSLNEDPQPWGLQHDKIHQAMLSLNPPF